MALKLITAPTALAVTLAELKIHLRRTDAADTSEDSQLTADIHTATRWCEQVLGGRAIMPQTWELTLDSFPDAFELTRTPVSSVTSITYAEAVAGASTVLSSTLYSLDTADENGSAWVLPAYMTNWPDTRDQANAVALRFVAGYADAAAVPYEIKSWIKLQCGAMDQNRESVVDRPGGQAPVALPYSDRLLDRYKIWH